MAAAIKQPGWTRAMIGAVIAGLFGFGLVVGLRAISGLEIFQTESTGYPHVIVPAILIPFGWLIGFGAFDYWFRWAAGKPTDPRGPLLARRLQLEGLLQVQHRSQGDRHPVHRAPPSSSSCSAACWR